jgi:hypothetical protein
MSTPQAEAVEPAAAPPPAQPQALAQAQPQAPAPSGAPPAVNEAAPSELPLFTPAPASPLQQALHPPKPPDSDRPRAPAGPPFDPSRPSSEQRFVEFFDAACVADGTEYAAMQSRAELGGWEPVPPLAVREGFDFAWVAALPTGERFAVLYDSLKQSCCLSTYRVRKGWVLGALKDKLPLRAPASGQLGAKEVYNYDLGEWMRISADFETLEANAVVASLCNTPR